MKQGSIIWGMNSMAPITSWRVAQKGKERIDYDGSNSFAKEMRDNATYVRK